MKAFKQFGFRYEKQFFWSYSVSLVLLGLTIMLSPVFAQNKDSLTNEPDIRMEINKEYDEHENLIRIDSSKIWSWCGIDIPYEQYDSIWREIGKNHHLFFHRNHMPGTGFFNQPPGPPLHHFWHWNADDSSAWSHLDELFDNNFSEHFKHPGFFADEDIHEKYDEYFKRFEEYREEHQKLIEKYFREPYQDEDIDPNARPKLNILKKS
ncbi:MAG: hypothetical protein K8S16_08310 [Bacteroidales bacterium]|nr:hypothetical protein [Bacteroidales bacterium]